MSQVWIAALFAIFVWWFSTGAILLVVRRADGAGPAAHRAAVAFGLPILAVGVAGAIATADRSDTIGAYGGFLSALAIWGWLELAFLTGVITGPSRSACPPGARGAERIGCAWRTIAYHEVALAAGLVLLAVLSLGGANAVALWTYAVLFAARILAKANLFLGVPRINLEFVPRPLEHLKSYFRQGPVTPAFPLAITLLTVALGWFLHGIWMAEAPAERAGRALLAAMTALALLEHWLMVLPLPDAKLWRWMLPEPAAPEGRYPSTAMRPSER